MAQEQIPTAEVPPPIPGLAGFHGIRFALVAMALAIMLAHVGFCGGVKVYHVFLVLFGLAYPYALRMAAARMARRRGRGRASLLLDGFFAGALLPAVAFDTVPSVVLVAISLFNWMAVGGLSLSVAGGVVMLAGALVSAAFLDQPAVTTCAASSLLAYAVLTIYLPFAAWVVFRYSAALRQYCDALQAERDAARSASHQATQAVLAVLPPSAAAELAETGRLGARTMVDGTLLLVDMGSPKPAERGIADLGEMFTVCDDIVGRHGLEGVKTLGGRYLALAMGAAGPDQALAAAREIAGYFAHHGAAGGREPLRIAIHCGALAAGLVQPERFNYDLTGPALDEILALARRGGPAEILVSEAARGGLSGEWRYSAVAGDGPAAFSLASGGAA